MTVYEGETFDQERALYGSVGVEVRKCTFDGPADGESALKESREISVSDSYFNLRYPFWHDEALKIENSEMTDKCRAAIWYSKLVNVKNTKFHGIKALRECADVTIECCEIISPEFGWSVEGITMKDIKAESEYFMLRSRGLNFENVSMKGKYSFQYIKDSEFNNCDFDTKDAFWHAKNITVRNSTVKSEYLAWYSENVTFENCTIIGTQPLCYCRGLRLIDCKMIGTDLSFEKSEVDARIIGSIDSIKNPTSGTISADEIKDIIMDSENPRVVLDVRG